MREGNKEGLCIRFFPKALICTFWTNEMYTAPAESKIFHKSSQAFQVLSFQNNHVDTLTRLLSHSVTGLCWRITWLSLLRWITLLRWWIALLWRWITLLWRWITLLWWWIALLWWWILVWWRRRFNRRWMAVHVYTLSDLSTRGTQVRARSISARCPATKYMAKYPHNIDKFVSGQLFFYLFCCCCFFFFFSLSALPAGKKSCKPLSQ